MKRAATNFGFSVALVALLGLVFLPVVATLAALFFDSARLTQGVQFSAIGDFQLNNVSAKFELLLADRTLFASFLRSFGLSCVVGIIVAWAAMASAFLVSRCDLGRAQGFYLVGYAAYLTPPVILVLSLAWLAGHNSSGPYAFLVVALGQCAFLFPLNFALALGHWNTAAYEVDRSGASDGAGIWIRFGLHMTVWSPSSAFGAGLALLTLMLAWSDVLFSRFLLMGSPEYRLLTDLVIERLRANDLVVARGELAAVAIMCAVVAAIVASLYAVMFDKANASQSC